MAIDGAAGGSETKADLEFANLVGSTMQFEICRMFLATLQLVWRARVV